MTSKNGLHPVVERAWANAVADSDPMPKGTTKVKGYDFNDGVHYDKLFSSLKTTGFQVR